MQGKSSMLFRSTPAFRPFACLASLSLQFLQYYPVRFRYIVSIVCGGISGLMSVTVLPLKPSSSRT